MLKFCVCVLFYHADNIALGTKSENIIFRKSKGKNPLTEKNTMVYLNHFSPLDFF